MGRKRSEADKWMPPRVYPGRSAYEFKPNSSTTIRLCSLDSPKALVIKRHAQEYELFHTKSGTLKALADKYFASKDFLKLAPRTQKDYHKYWEKLNKVFGKMNADSLEPQHIRKFLDKMGMKSEVQANRHVSLLSRIYAWGYERGEVKRNPCKGVKKFSEKARDRYVEDTEYQAIYDNACLAVKVAMEIAYLCAAREGDIVKLKKSQLLEEGIKIKQGKTGKVQIKAWSPRLRAAIALAKTIKTKVDSIYVIPTRTGSGYTEDGLRSQWDKARKKAREKTGLELGNLTFHDLKAKSISDYEGDKQKFSGHKTASQVQVYDRKTSIVETLNPGKKVSE